MAVAPLPQDIANQLKYGPRAATAVQRSQYLTDALKQMTDQSQPIRGGLGEVGARLLATAILSRGLKSANRDALGAVKADQDAETASLLGPLTPTPVVPPAAPPPMPAAPSVATGTNPNAPPPAINGPTAAPASTSGLSPDRLALAQTVWGEARGEPAAGQQAVAAVILNRAKASGKSPAQVVSAPHQFSGYNPRSQALTPEQLAPILANIDPVVSGAAPDPTGGADHFYNPALASPSWGQGAGQTIGAHKFMRLNDQGHAAQPDVQMTAGPPPQGPMQVAPTTAAAQAPPAADPAAQPFQVAANTLQPGMVPGQPSAQGSSPPDAGTPPAAPLPQAAAGGHSWPTWKPSQQEFEYVQGLLVDPRTHAQGVQAAMQMRQKMTQPVSAKIVTMNGMSFYVPDDPTSGAPTMAIPVPKEAMSQTLSAEQAGVAAPPGTSFNKDPLGNIKQVYQPQNGQEIISTPGGHYREAPIQGGTNDPLAPAARFTNEGKLRDDYAKEIQPYVAAREGYQKVISAAGDHTQAGAIAMVFGVMKTLDPSSTVREGEQAQVQNSGTIPQSITNLYNKLLGGTGSLDDAQRAQFANMAQHQFGVYQKTFDAANQRYGSLAQSYGMDPRNVVRSFDPIEPYHPPASGGGGVPAAARNAYVGLYNQGRIDTSKPDGHALHPMIAATPEILQGMDTPANRGKHVITPDGQLAVIE